MSLTQNFDLHSSPHYQAIGNVATYCPTILTYSASEWNTLNESKSFPPLFCSNGIQRLDVRSGKAALYDHAEALPSKRTSPLRRVMCSASMCSSNGRIYFRVAPNTSRASATVIWPCSRI